jgi:hypothetical protein
MAYAPSVGATGIEEDDEEEEGSLSCSQQPSTGSYPEPDQSILPHHIYLRFILLLFSHLRPGVSSGLFHSGFHTNILYAFLSAPIRATCSSHLILIRSF